eukprot:3256702-Amphidinium_carterae.1
MFSIVQALEIDSLGQLALSLVFGLSAGFNKSTSLLYVRQVDHGSLDAQSNRSVDSLQAPWRDRSCMNTSPDHQSNQ